MRTDQHHWFVNHGSESDDSDLTPDYNFVHLAALTTLLRRRTDVSGFFLDCSAVF